MNNKIRLTFFLIIISLGFSQLNGEVLYNQKYLTVGVLSNEAIPQFTENPNIRFLGKYSKEALLKNGGKLMLDKLFNLDHPSIQYLYDQGFKESTKEEYEIAIKDISADPKTILQSEGAIQLIKNNYIIIFKPDEKKIYDKVWEVYHVEIDDEIINQVFLNWDNSSMLKEISVPIKLLATGRILNDNLSRIIFNISKKVGEFAIRGPVISSHPTRVEITEVQGIRLGDNLRVYKTIENKEGVSFSKKIGDAVCLEPGLRDSKIKMISGRYPNYKNGDIAIVKANSYGWIMEIGAQYSFGSDWRAGGDFKFGKRIKYRKSGIYDYWFVEFQYSQFNKDPKGVFFSEPSFNSESIQPTLNGFSFFGGYGLGYSFLTKFEINPYISIGFGEFKYYGFKKAYMWDTQHQKFLVISNGPTPDAKPSFGTVSAKIGINLAYNIYYPLQLLIGCNYNAAMTGGHHSDYDHSSFITDRHDMSRFNVSLGLKYKF